MRNRKIIYYVLGMLAVLTIIVGVIVLRAKDDSLKVVFLNVGQGDGILIEQGTTQVLIDGGKDGTTLLEGLGKYVPFWDRDIEMVVETHPDQDHIGALAELFRVYNVKTVLKTDMPGTSQTFKNLEDVIAREHSQVIQAHSGEKITFANGAEADVIFPFGSVADLDPNDTNAASVVIRLTYGKNSFLFTGDLPIQQEDELLANHINVQADVLKVGHHGSKYSSSNEFLDAVKARDGIISVGANNPYGHPNPEALARLRSHGAAIIRTDELGDIVYACQDINSQCQQENPW